MVGSSVYRVGIFREGAVTISNCTCPAFWDYGACKHIAATGLAAIYSQKEGYYSSSYCRQRIKKQKRYEDLLNKKSKDELVLAIIRLSNEYPEIIDILLEDELVEEPN